MQGAENCLEGCVFVVTGVLESMERDDAKSLIERHGGKVTGNISKKTTYLVQGRDSGVSKLEKVSLVYNKRNTCKKIFPDSLADITSHIVYANTWKCDLTQRSG